MNETIKEYLDNHINEHQMALTQEQYQDVYNGVEYWFLMTLPEAISDAISAHTPYP